MPRLRRIIIGIALAFSSFFLLEAKAQCPNDNVFLADLTPLFSGDTAYHNCIHAGQYITTNVKSGYTYIFSTCGHLGFNTQMTLRNAAGTVWYAFNDNFCGQQSQITWNATFTGSVKLLIDLAPSCQHDTICQKIRVIEQCKANVGTFTSQRNGVGTSSPIYLCEGRDTLSITSNNNFQLPFSAPGEQAEIMYMVFTCPPTSAIPTSDPCFSGTFLPSSTFSDPNPGFLTTGNSYYLIPVTVDDGDNAGNPNNLIQIDATGDSCYAVGSPIIVHYLNPLAFASNIDCINRSVLVQVFGGRSEVDASNYTITNTGSGVIATTNIKHGDTVEISGLSNGSMYSFNVTDANGCQASFSGGPFYSPNAGSDRSLRFCVSKSPFFIGSYLSAGHDTIGIWYGPNNAAMSDYFIPGISPTGTWKYVVDGALVCEDDTAYINIQIDSLYEAGNNNSITICQFDSMVSLWPLLSANADTTGTFYNTSTLPFSGILISNNTFAATRRFKYLVNAGTACPRDSAIITVNMKPYPKAGRDTSVTFCSNKGLTALFNFIPGVPDNTGTWLNPYSAPFSGSFNPLTDSTGVYTYRVVGQSPCPVDTSFMNVGVEEAPFAGPDSSASFCQSNQPISLYSLLPPNILISGGWYSPTNVLLAGGLFNPSIHPQGVYKYIINGTSPCQPDTALWTINITAPPNPGLNDSLFFCSYNQQVLLSGQLAGTPDAGGIWYNPSSIALTGPFNPSIDISGWYTYTVSGNSPCMDSSSYHFITIVSSPNPGIGSLINLCSNNSPMNLFSALSGNPQTGGAWKDPFSNSTIMPFVPGVYNEGVYSYTVQGTGPCLDSSSYVTVNVEDAVNPGMDSSISVCTIDSTFLLFNILGGTPDPLGSWFDSKWLPASGSFDPGIQMSDTFHYTVSATTPCLDSSASVIVQVFNAPNPGVGSTRIYCSNNDPVNLITVLSGNPDVYGTWKNPVGMSHSGNFIPGTDSAGNYLYTVPGSGSCQDSSTTVSIQMVQAPNPGHGDSTAFCTNDNQTNLIQFLTNVPDTNGTWYDPASNLFSGIFYPPVDLPGNYTYTVQGTYPCRDSSTTLKVNLNSFSNPGLNGSIDVCETNAIFSLFGVLGGTPQTTGSWRNSLNQPVSNFFNPATDSTAFFVYTVPGKPPCRDSSATVQVHVRKDVNAGKDTALAFCSNETTLNLFNLIPGNPQSGGVWMAPGSLPFNGVFNPNLDSGGTYTYHVTAQAPCPNKFSTIQVQVSQLYNAGGDASLVICEDEQTFNFFGKLNGSPDINGYWVDPNGYVFDGYSNNVILESGIYTYVIPSNLPCLSDSAFIQLAVNNKADAGNGLALTLCENAEPVFLYSLLNGSPDSTGLWYTPSQQFSGGYFNPTSDPLGVYTYVVQGNYPCVNDSAFVSIELAPLPSAGPDQNVLVCFGERRTNLFDRLTSPGNPGGIWLDPLNQQMSGIFVPGKNVLGKYRYVIPGNIYCPGDTMVAQVKLSEPFEIDAGRDVTLLYGERKTMSASSYKAIRYEWQPQEGLSNPYSATTQVFCNDHSTYVVFGFDENGCSANDTVQVSVFANIFVPNSFTPNRDGINDTWVIKGLEEYDNFSLYVLNDDRQVVFQTSAPKDWWDGTFKGDFVPAGRYFYRIEFHDKVRFSDMSGFINVIR